MTRDATSSAVPGEAGVKALGLPGIAALLGELGEPRFRGEQLVRWLYQRGARSYEEMTDLPASLREQLSGRLALPFPEVVERQVSSDGTRKYLLRLADGSTVETVGLPSEGSGRLTVCFSTQAGCRMGCAFCATGAAGFTRNLGPGEMVDQLSVVAEDFGARITNVVAMGQGEPFANYENVVDALRIMNADAGLGIGARHITVSTCGLVAGIQRFSGEPEQFTLAVSLHSAVQETRDRLMPGVAGISLGDLRSALADYAKQTGRRPSVEYAMMAGVNDTAAELAALLEFCKGLLVHVNLIPANPVAGTGIARPEPGRVREFERALAESGIEVSVRAERGADVDAACGQLRQRQESVHDS